MKQVCRSGWPLFDADGRQYVLNNDGKPVYGVWIYLDELDIVTRETPPS